MKAIDLIKKSFNKCDNLYKFIKEVIEIKNNNIKIS